MGDFKGAEDDYRLAYAINEFNFQRSDSLKLQEEMYLRRLMAFSGEFTDSKEPGNRIQDRAVEIDLKPAYATVLFTRSMEGIRLYDTFSKPVYHTTLLSLVNDPALINTWMAESELERLTDTLAPINSGWEDYLKLAELHFELQDYSKALEDYEQAIRLNPGMVRPWFGRANTRLKLIGMKASEEGDLYLFSANTGFNAPPGEEAAMDQEFDYGEVIRDYDRVIELDPGFQYAWYNRGYVKALNGNYWGAISDLTRAAELDPEFADAFYNKGLLLIYLNLKAVGCQDISMAGELGIEDAYAVLKRYCVK
jgi:tetratricopeptide (TPR) repeat protein